MQTYADWRVGAWESEMYNSNESILLTFDDSGTASQLDSLLHILETEKVRAVFFVQGDWADKNPELVEGIVRAGHLVANHTYTHADLLSLSDEGIRQEIGRGVKSPWLRPPRGRYNARVRTLAAELGMSIKYWTIDSGDWQGVSAQQMSDKILSQLHAGAVILFHIHGAHTTEALPGLIREIRGRGYRLCAPGEQPWETQL